MKLEIPENVKKYEVGSSIVWFDQGILYLAPSSRVTSARSEVEILKDLRFLKELAGNKKACIILESNPHSPPPTKKEREFISTQMENITKAMAIITSSPLSRMIANLFFGFKPPSYPVKMFTDVSAAKEWIQKYCNE